MHSPPAASLQFLSAWRLPISIDANVRIRAQLSFSAPSCEAPAPTSSGRGNCRHSSSLTSAKRLGPLHIAPGEFGRRLNSPSRLDYWDRSARLSPGLLQLH